MQEITYEIECDDCGTEYSVVNIIEEESLIDRPIFCPFCGNGVSLPEADGEMDEMDKLLDELDELDFDVD